MSFNTVQGKIEQEGYSPKAAGAILASSTRKASPAAKKANPNLTKVKGEPDADDKKKPMKKKGKPAAKVQPQWAGIANKMLGNE